MVEFFREAHTRKRLVRVRGLPSPSSPEADFESDENSNRWTQISLGDANEEAENDVRPPFQIQGDAKNDGDAKSRSFTNGICSLWGRTELCDACLRAADPRSYDTCGGVIERGTRVPGLHARRGPTTTDWTTDWHTPLWWQVYNAARSRKRATPCAGLGPVSR
jgi:hypothetical protein